MEIGIDIVDINRLEIRDDWIRRILSNKEVLEFTLFRENSTLLRQKEFLAGRWACKEAILKVIDKKVPLHELEITKSTNKLFCIHENKTIKLSLTHNRTLCIAIAFM